MPTLFRNFPTGLFFLILSLLAVSCGPAPTQPGTSNVGSGNQLVKSKLKRVTGLQISQNDQQALAAGNQAFAVDLYQQLRGETGNLFFSPYSISLALAMTYGGAAGETARQMAQTLQFTLPPESLHPAFNALDQSLMASAQANGSPTPTAGFSEGQDFQLSIANSIWGQSGYSFQQAYLDLLAQNYGAGLRATDFAGAPEPSRQAINDWVMQQTNDKIKDLFPAGTIDASTRLALVNAIYFKASWLFPFYEETTKDGLFTLKDGSQVKVPMMASGQAAQYYEKGDNYQAVGLEYYDQNTMMVIVLPDEGKFDDFEAGLSASRLDTILDGLEPGYIDLTMPKFKVESSFGLNDTLAKMGMTLAFDPSQADFSGMDGKKDLFISAVVHKAFVSVDEKGTEAAAATGVAMPTTAILNPPVVQVDRPFFFAIYHPGSGTVLFAGRMMDPSQ